MERSKKTNFSPGETAAHERRRPRTQTQTSPRPAAARARSGMGHLKDDELLRA